MRAAPLALSALALALAAPPAEACTCAYQPPRFVGAAVELPQNAKLQLVGCPAFVNHIELRQQALESSSRTGTLTESRVSLRTATLGYILAEVTPEAPLPVGTELALWTSQSGGAEGHWDRVAAWRVGPARAIVPPAAPEHVIWFADRFDRTAQYCDGPSQEVALLQVVVPAGTRAPLYEVRIVDPTGQEQTWALLPWGAAPLSAVLYSWRPADCIEVRGVGIDGTRGPAARTCQPDRCIYRPGDGSYRLPDWDAVPEPCNLDCTPRPEGGYECIAPAAEGDAGTEGVDLAGELDAGGCACHAVEGAHGRAVPWGGLAVLWAGFAMLVGGRRRIRRSPRLPCR